MFGKTTCRHIEHSEISQIVEEKRGFPGRALPTGRHRQAGSLEMTF